MVKLAFSSRENTNPVLCCLWMQCMVSLHVLVEHRDAFIDLFSSLLLNRSFTSSWLSRAEIWKRPQLSTTSWFSKRGEVEVHEFLRAASPRSSLVCLSCSSVSVGSDTKAMVSKIKLQFDELREKVEFLESVKTYLQVCAKARAAFPLLWV